MFLGRRAFARFRASWYPNPVIAATMVALAMAAPAPLTVAGVDFRWAPAIGEALPRVTGRGKDVADGFDATILDGLSVRVNEIDAAMPEERRAAVEASLQALAPVVARLRKKGVSLDERGAPSAELAGPLSEALAAEREAADARALSLARYRVDEHLDFDRALADARAADALLRERGHFLSPGALARFSAAYEPGRTQTLLARREQERRTQLAALATPEDRLTMRDAVADKPAAPKSLLGRLADKARSLLGR